ncbi:hypothetical protein LTR28_010361 [Elasticomyces elasticus]|nr:hypothetical protein LTR28_010361 [Elasticomyces elasticus]
MSAFSRGHSSLFSCTNFLQLPLSLRLCLLRHPSSSPQQSALVRRFSNAPPRLAASRVKLPPGSALPPQQSKKIVNAPPPQQPKKIIKAAPHASKPTASSNPPSSRTTPVPTPPLKPAAPPPPAPTARKYTSATGFAAFASQLAQRGSPTLLYRSPSHTRLIVLSYLSAFAMFSTAYTWVGPALAASNLPVWVSSVQVATAVCFAGSALYLAYAPAKCIKSITAVPPQLGALAKGAARTDAKPTLRFEISRLLPFTKPTFIDVSPEDCALDRSVAVMLPTIRSSLPAAEQRHANLRPEEQLQLAARRDRDLQAFDRAHLLTMPFRRLYRLLARVASALFSGVIQDGKKMMWRHHLAYVRIKGRGNWKVDLAGAWVLDGGRALDRIVRVDDGEGVRLGTWETIRTQLPGNRSRTV